MTPFEVLNEVKRRSAEAVIAQSGLAHEGLRRHLRALLGGDNPAIGAMLQQPVLEGARPFVTADATMAALSGSRLHPDLVAALDGPQVHCCTRRYGEDRQSVDRSGGVGGRYLSRLLLPLAPCSKFLAEDLPHVPAGHRSLQFTANRRLLPRNLRFKENSQVC